MAKWVSDAALDGALAVVAGANRMVATTTQPADYAAAVAGTLAGVAMAPGDFSVGAAGGGGRELSVAGKTGVPVTAAGTAGHVALIDTAAEALLYVTTAPAEELHADGTVDFAGFTLSVGGVA